MRLFSLLFLVLLFFSCKDELRSPGKPLMAFNFNGKVLNQGLAQVWIEGDALVSYHFGEKDTCLDLMASAKYRKPVVIHYDQAFSLNDYGGFTISVWVQKAREDAEEYSILSQQEYVGEMLTGWEIRAEKCGSWSWSLSDTIQSWSYTPTKKQAINDGAMHQIAFSFDKYEQEARLYFDGRNVAVYSLFGHTFDLGKAPLRLGVSPSSSSESMDMFNGRIDDLSFWSRPLFSSEIQQVYTLKTNHTVVEPEAGEHLKVMTWDIWQGGMHEGKHVGAERILDVIKSTDSDLILLQEMAGIGPVLADGLGYYYYHRSFDLGVLSRFPLMESKNLYRPQNAACIKVNLGRGKYVFACPIALSSQPRLDTYIKGGEAEPDSIYNWEMEGRGKEMTFILGELRHLQNTNENIPMILGGGFYSGSHLDWTERNRQKNYGLVIDYPVSKQMERAGFKDTYRVLHPDETMDLGYTWSPKFKSALPNRTDVIYYFGDYLSPSESFVIDDHLISFPSNHASVVSVFEFEKK